MTTVAWLPATEQLAALNAIVTVDEEGARAAAEAADVARAKEVPTPFTTRPSGPVPVTSA